MQTIFHSSSYSSRNECNTNPFSPKTSSYSDKCPQPQAAQRVLFRKRDGTDWVKIVWHPSGALEGVVEKAGQSPQAIALKGLPSQLKPDHEARAKALLENTPFKLTDYTVEFLPGLRGGMDDKKKKAEKVLPHNLNTSLSITYEGQNIEFHIHEVVKILMDLVEQKLAGVRQLSPQKKANLDTYPLEELVNKPLNPSNLVTEDVVPLDKIQALIQDCLIPQYTPIHTLNDVLNFLNSQSINDAKHGWWLEIGGRVIHIKGTKHNNFYASDYGFLENLKKTISESSIAFLYWIPYDITGKEKDTLIKEFNISKNVLKKIEEKNLLKKSFEKDCVKKIKKIFQETILVSDCISQLKQLENINEAQKQQIDKILFILLQEAAVDPKNLDRKLENKDYQLNYQSSKDTEQLLVKQGAETYFIQPNLTGLYWCIQSMTKDDPDRFKKECSLIKYITVILREKAYDLKVPEYFRESSNIDSSEIEKMKRTLAGIVLAAVKQDIQAGHWNSLLRVKSYGGLGDNYPDFADAITAYLDSPGALSPQKLATRMRDLLNGESLEPEEENLSFLPCLLAAWFISEGSRNPTAVLDYLIVLDLLEAEAEKVVNFDKDLPKAITEEMTDEEKKNFLGNHNLYSWENMLRHPLSGFAYNHQSTFEFKIKDTCNQENSIFIHGGTAGMCGDKSMNNINKEKKLKNGEKLNIVRPKEGSLTLEWLSTHLAKDVVKLRTEYPDKNNKDHPILKVNYDEIMLNDYAIDKYVENTKAEILITEKSITILNDNKSVNETKKDVNNLLKDPDCSEALAALIRKIMPNDCVIRKYVENTKVEEDINNLLKDPDCSKALAALVQKIMPNDDAIRKYVENTKAEKDINNLLKDPDCSKALVVLTRNNIIQDIEKHKLELKNKIKLLETLKAEEESLKLKILEAKEASDKIKYEAEKTRLEAKIKFQKEVIEPLLRERLNTLGLIGPIYIPPAEEITIPGGFRRIGILGDGNCLFRCFAQKILENEYLHADYRNQIINWMRENSATMNDFLQGVLQDAGVNDVEGYINRMAQQNIHGDEPEVRAASQALQRRIVVYRANNPEQAPTVYGEVEGFPDDNTTIHLLYSTCQYEDREVGHYDLLVRQDP